MRSIILLFIFFISFNSFSQERPKIGLVLSGGGAKGSAHVGAIRFLESKGIKPDFITGTSVGSMIGGLYAMGYTVDELDEIVRTTDWDYLSNDEIKRENLLIGQGGKNKSSIISLPIEGFKPTLASGLYTGQNLLSFLQILSKEYDHELNFDSLPIPFRCIGTNIETGEEMVFKSGILAEAIRSSMSIPSVLTPYEINNEYYVDGGLVNNFPTDVIKEMGADIIIGVDVGAVLYKKDEIKTIMQILDQTASFYNARVSEKNKKLCDIYIRPDVADISAMEFYKAVELIDKGYVAAVAVEDKIDSVFGKYNLKPIINEKKYIDTNVINIDSIVVTTNIKLQRHKNSAEKLILGKLNLNTPIVITQEDLINRMNRLFGAKFFQNISLIFEKKDTSYILHISAEQKQDDEFFFGARYDNTYGINLSLGANFRNKLVYGSLFEMKLIAGQSPQLKLRYTTDRGKSLGLGSSIEYNNFLVNAYENGDIYSTFNYNRTLWDVFVHSYMKNHNRAIIGIEASIFGLTTTQSISGIGNMYRNNYSLYAAYIADNWDNGYFPSKGVRTKIRGDLIMQEDNSIISTIWLRNEAVIPLSKRFALMADVFVGLGSKGVDTTLYSFFIGGMGKNRIQWYNAFPGLHFLEDGSSNVGIISVGPRWKISKNHYLTYKFAFAMLDDMTDRFFSRPSRMYGGMSLTYGLNSMLGPMEASFDISLNNKYGSVFFSLGFWL